MALCNATFLGLRVIGISISWLYARSTFDDFKKVENGEC